MKKVGITRICIVIVSSVFMLLVCLKSGWSAEWTQINPSSFKDRDEAAQSFQEAIFDNNHLYVVTSDSDRGFEDSDMKDPNRKTVLWTSEIYEDPNEWKDKVNDNPDVWRVLFDKNTARVDSLFSGFGYIYAGLEYDGNCRIYRFLDPDQKQEVIIEIEPEIRSKWRVDNGEEFRNMLYIGIYDDDYGGRVFRGDSPCGPIGYNSEVKHIYGIQAAKDPNRKISLLTNINETSRTDERLFVGTRHPVPGVAVLSYTYYGNIWELSDQATFKDSDDPDNSENIRAFLSMVEFVGNIWLLAENKKDGKKQWALWKTGVASDELQWKKQTSSQDPNGPFFDPNIMAVSGLQPIGDYLYLACLYNDGGRIWKSYHGENDEWICVPSPSDPDNSFGPDNLLRGIFFNPNDIDYLFAGTKNEKGARILARLVPRIDILNLTMKGRFLGPEKTGIKMDIRPNWGGTNYWEDPNHLRPDVVSSQKEPIAIHSHSVDPNQSDFSLWEFDPNMLTKEGIYYLKWELAYGEDNERVVRYLSFAWDTNSPSAPKNLEVGEGDGRLKIKWETSSDSIKESAESVDPNFSQSVWRYRLEWWPEGDSNRVAYKYITQKEYSGEVTISNLQNNITYKVQVMAMDKAKNESGWSEGRGTPQETLGWLELLEKKGGCFISSVNSGKSKDPGGARRWFAGLKAGRYKPASDEADLVYGEDRPYPVQAEIGWIHRPRLEISFGTGYIEMDGTAIKDLSGKKSIDSVTFRIIPCSMTFRWIPFGNSGSVLIPYLGGGMDAWWYQEDEPDGKDIDGWNYGYHGGCGIRWSLDSLDPRNARSLETDFGVKDTCLILEVVYNWIDDFGDSRLDLGGVFYQAGILFLF